MEHFVVTITRQFGSLGRPIARQMSEILGIDYYDRDIVDQAAKKLKLPISVVDQEEEKAVKQAVNPFSRMIFPLGKGTVIRRIKFSIRRKISYSFFQKKTTVLS